MSAVCLVCGCTDEKACEGGCSWVHVSNLLQVGICSNTKCVKRYDEECENLKEIFGTKPATFPQFLQLMSKPFPSPGAEVSEVGDLTKFVKVVEALFEQQFGERPGLAIAFTLPGRSTDVHWVTNVSREDGIKLFEATAQKMQEG